MCQRIVDFCNGSTKPLLFVGAALSILLAIAIGYTACTAQLLYSQAEPELAQSLSTGYYLQLSVAVYLLVVAALSCQAAYYEQKNVIRALAIISSINFVLAIAALAMTPTAVQMTGLFEPTLTQAKDIYDFKEAPSAPSNITSVDQRESEDRSLTGRVANSTANHSLPKRSTTGDEAQNSASAKGAQKLTPQQATKLWDALQARGCCGLKDASSTWQADKLPKSCCASSLVKQKDESYFCPKVDEQHEQGCLHLIGSLSQILFIVIASIAIDNLYLALITGISTYKTLQYSEASQSAYT